MAVVAEAEAAEAVATRNGFGNHITPEKNTVNWQSTRASISVHRTCCTNRLRYSNALRIGK